MTTQATITSIMQIIKDIDPMAASVDELDPEGSLNEQGIDSLEMMSIFLGIEEEYSVKFPDQDIEELDSVSTILEYTNKLIAAS